MVSGVMARSWPLRLRSLHAGFWPSERVYEGSKENQTGTGDAMLSLQCLFGFMKYDSTSVWMCPTEAKAADANASDATLSTTQYWLQPSP